MRTHPALFALNAALILCAPTALRAAPTPGAGYSPTATISVADPQDVPHDGSPKRHKNGKISECVLARDVTLFRSVTLPAGSKLRFHDTGHLARCVLSRETTLSGNVIPAKSTVFFSARGCMSSCWLARDTLIRGHLCRANDDGFGNCFYPNGALCAAWLARDEEIDGIPCTSSADFFKMPIKAQRAGTGRMAYFYPNGKLMQGMLSRDFTIEGRAYKIGDIIRLSEDGRLMPDAKPVPPPPRW